MIEGWNIETDTVKTVEGTMLSLNAEPVFAEIGEKVRELTGQLHEKIMSQELKWSLMLTSLHMVKELRDMCNHEIERRELEIEELSKDK